MAKGVQKASRFDDKGEWLWHGVVPGYVAARRKGAMPRLFSRREWDAMSRMAVIDTQEK